MINQSVVIFSLILSQAPQAFNAGQNQFIGLVNDIKIVEKESAEAKAVRLRWISEERSRIHKELSDYAEELEKLRAAVPDPVRSHKMTAIAAKSHEVELSNFNSWCQNNDPEFRIAILRGPGINALLRVLGPIAHYRLLRPGSLPADKGLPCLDAGDMITPEEAEHFRLNPATSAGSRFVVRLNQTPLQLEWPPVVIHKWSSDCDGIAKTRNAFVNNITLNVSDKVRVDSAELLDDSLKLLQAKIVKDKETMLRTKRLDIKERVEMFRELQDAIRYVETVRASVDRFKRAPGDFAVRRFNGGNIEEFLDFCYTHGMFFGAALPPDEAFYLRLHVRMKDYAKDIQFFEDWKDDIRKRMDELNSNDQKLLWAASEQ